MHKALETISYQGKRNENENITNITNENFPYHGKTQLNTHHIKDTTREGRDQATPGHGVRFFTEHHSYEGWQRLCTTKNEPE